MDTKVTVPSNILIADEDNTEMCARKPQRWCLFSVWSVSETALLMHNNVKTVRDVLGFKFHLIHTDYFCEKSQHYRCKHF